MNPFTTTTLVETPFPTASGRSGKPPPRDDKTETGRPDGYARMLRKCDGLGQ